MASQSYTIEIQRIILSKFNGYNRLRSPDKINSMDIKPQVHGVSIYQSIHSTVMQCELSVVDYIGLFVNWPLTGEEILTIEYRNTADDLSYSLDFVIQEVSDVSYQDNNRAVGFIIKCVSLEALFNSLYTVQQSYQGTMPNIARQIFQEYIVAKTTEHFPTHITPIISIEDNETQPQVVVIPNLRPFAAIDMVRGLAVSEVENRYSYVFYQDIGGFHLKTIQGMTQSSASRRFARDNSYKFFSNEINENTSNMNNQERVIANLKVNRRHSNLQKLHAGYFNNNLFEINIAQKAYWVERSSVDQVQGIYPHLLNTQPYVDFAKSINNDNEVSNRTKYIIRTQREHDDQFPVSRQRQKWGKDLITNISMSQIDIDVVIPGTNRFRPGDMFHMDLSEAHGFNNIEDDDLITGLYLITDVKHVISIGNMHSTALKLNKDSYFSSVDRASRYGQ